MWKTMKKNILNLVSMKLCILLLFLTAGSFQFCSQSKETDKPRIVEVRKIWDKAKHNAFTDLIRFQEKWYCTFREADAHAPASPGSREDGKIRIIVSDDGIRWQSAGLLEEEGIDLRDPKFSITADGKLMVIMGGSLYVSKDSSPEKETRIGMFSRVAFSPDGQTWPQVEKIRGKELNPDDTWLWRVTWHQGMAYGFTKSPVRLWKSGDGIRYEAVTDSIHPEDEATLRFMPDGEMIALFRKPAAIGTSSPPYTEWKINEAGFSQLGGPNFIILPDGQMWGGSRNTKQPVKTVLARMTRNSYEMLLELPSGGDTSYPGFVWHDGFLWMSYYSSHEEKTSIYLAKIGIH